MRISLVLPEHLPDAWPQVEGYIARAADYTNGKCLAADIRNWLCDEYHYLWVAFEEGGKIYGAVTTRFVEYPSCKVLSIEFVGGERLSEWKDDMLAVIENFAKNEGCSVLQGIGRRGWGRELMSNGWRQTAAIYEKELAHVGG
jgi:hypothetical protein